jgi:endonuclease/exonuclease/phosphatase family metal-dependent hydrolase
MKKSILVMVVFAIFFLFLIQLAGSLVESIYILDLMNTSLDEKALGVLFFFSPALLLFFRKKMPKQIVWVTFGLLLITRGFTPYLNTLGRMLASGVGTGAGLILFPFLLTAQAKEDADNHQSLWISTGMALAVALSVLLRTVNYSLDYSLQSEGSWVGWGMGVGFGFLLTLLDWNPPRGKPSNAWSLTLPVTGIFLVIGLVYFAFSAPAVISRWTEGSYSLIVMIVSLLAVGWIGLSLSRSSWFENISPTGLLAWNLLFTLSLTVTILANRVSFPLTPDSPAVVVGTPMLWQQVPLVFTLLFFPVIFLDLRVFYDRIQDAQPTPRDLIPGLLLGCLVLVLLVFIHIFTNVWGYVEPISPWFRNKFWLPYLLMTGLISLLIGRKGLRALGDPPAQKRALTLGFGLFLTLIVLGTAGSALFTTRTQESETGNRTLVVMTYNIQQANDADGERSYDRQLALIQQVAPDILALQESDSSRISLNNNDFVRYYAGKLGYYSYYGPTTVSGTYGTAILSRHPLKNTRTVFTFSDQDEIGTAEAEIDIGGQRLTIYNVHPAGSDTVMLAWANTLRSRSAGKENVIALGDYNLRDSDEAYQLIANVYTNAWESVYPSKVGSDGTDMSGENRIDHIFLSPSLMVRDSVYVLPPDSATDHPVHWAEIYLKE